MFHFVIYLTFTCFVCVVNSAPSKSSDIDYLSENIFLEGNNKLLISYENATEVSMFELSSARTQCLVCHSVLSTARFMLKERLPLETVISLAVEVCGWLNSPEVCRGAVQIFKNETLQVLPRVNLSTEEICQVLTMNNCSGHVIEAMKWFVKIPPKRNDVNIKNIKNDPKTIYRVLHVSDIHLDLQYNSFSNALCAEPLCCRKGQPADPKAKAGYWGDYRNCDIPLWTLQEAFKQMSKQHYDHILWTGDAISHNIWNQTREDQLIVLDIIMGLFDRYFPGVPVYSSIGNHEEVPVNSFPTPFSNHTSKWLYERVYHYWSPWLPVEAKDDVLKGGFYSAKVPSSNLRIVSLNMNFCNNFNGWLLLNSTDPFNQLDWLIRVLLKAEDDGEKVHMIGHIPPGAPECLRWWSFNYNNIVRRFEETIVAQFFGHRHFDSFEVFYDDLEIGHASRAISVAYLSPSLTTFPNINPAYREYEIQLQTWKVLDHRTYIMDLETSNTLKKAVWKLEYSMMNAYKMGDLSAESYNALVMRMKEDRYLFDSYFKYYHKSYLKGKDCDETCKLDMMCALITSQSYDNRMCQKLLNHHRNLDAPISKTFITLVSYESEHIITLMVVFIMILAAPVFISKVISKPKDVLMIVVLLIALLVTSVVVLVDVDSMIVVIIALLSLMGELIVIMVISDKQ